MTWIAENARARQHCEEKIAKAKAEAKASETGKLKAKSSEKGKAKAKAKASETGKLKG